MSYLDAFRSACFAINWRTIALGWDGPCKWPRLLTLADVQEFAGSLLSAPSSADEPALIRLVAASADDIEGVTKEIHTLANGSAADPERELRKWRVVLLKDELWKCPRNPLYGLLALTEFWEKFGYPEDGPHTVQGRGNTSTPNEYYSEENYRRLLKRHADWIETELRALGPGTE